MTKEMLMEFLEGYEDGEQVCEQDLARFYQDVADARERMIEEIEERVSTQAASTLFRILWI